MVFEKLKKTDDTNLKILKKNVYVVGVLNFNLLIIIIMVIQT